MLMSPPRCFLRSQHLVCTHCSPVSTSVPLWVLLKSFLAFIPSALTWDTPHSPGTLLSPLLSLSAQPGHAAGAQPRHVSAAASPGVGHGPASPPDTPRKGSRGWRAMPCVPQPLSSPGIHPGNIPCPVLVPPWRCTSGSPGKESPPSSLCAGVCDSQGEGR